MNYKYLHKIFALVFVLSLFSLSEAKLNEEDIPTKKLEEEDVASNDIDDTPDFENKLFSNAKPIAQMLKTFQQWLHSIPDTIVSLLVHLLSPFVDKDVAHQKAKHIIHGFTNVITREFPKSYQNMFHQIFSVLDIFEAIGQ